MFKKEEEGGGDWYQNSATKCRNKVKGFTGVESMLVTKAW